MTASIWLACGSTAHRTQLGIMLQDFLLFDEHIETLAFRGPTRRRKKMLRACTIARVETIRREV